MQKRKMGKPGKKILIGSSEFLDDIFFSITLAVQNSSNEWHSENADQYHLGQYCIVSIRQTMQVGYQSTFVHQQKS